MGSLSNLYISQSYQSLIHLATNNTASATLIALQDGLGNSIGVSVNTGGDLSLSGSLTASLQQGYVWVGNANNKTALVSTSSFGGGSTTDITSLNQFTASQLNINAGYNQYTSSTNIRLNNLESNSASVNISISNLNASSASQQLQINSLIAATGSYVTSAITASSLVTASVNLNTITFTKGDASTFNITINTGSGGGGTTDISSLNAFTASQETKDLTLASVTSSLNSATASLFTSASNGLVTASISGQLLSFTKGNNSQFTLNIPTGSGTYVTGSYGSFQDSTTQSGSANTAYKFNFNQTDVSDGVILSGSTGLKVGAYGVYNLEWSGQAVQGASSAIVSVWVNVNGIQVSGSRGDVTLASNTKLLPAWNYFLTLNANDVVELQWASDSANTTWQALPTGTTPVTPAAASIIATLARVDVGGGSNSVSTTIFNSYTASTNIWTASIDQKFATIGGQSGSWGGGGSINTSSFATTGSNVFRGDQTFQDAGLNATTLVSTSGSLMLVAKSYTSASAHMTASANLVNLIFKDNNNTADTIISGSNNIFVNPAAPTAGFKRYIGGGNIILNASNVPQISGSMAFSPTMNNNYFPGNATTVIMRGPVSSSTWNINGNNILGNVFIGTTAANNAEKIVSGLTMTGNTIIGTLGIVANQNSLTSLVTTNNNVLGGVITLNLNSSSVTFNNNTVLDSGFTWTNNYYTGSIGAGLTQANRNLIIGQTNSILTTGILDAAAGATQPGYINNLMGGTANQVFTNATSASTNHSLSSTIIYGNTLIVSASSAQAGTNVGSAFFGRYGVNDGVRNRTASTIFSVGTGTGTGARKTGFLIDSGSNTFVEGTLTVSGSTRITGSLTMSGSILFVDRSGNDTNTYLGLNALGMGNAGAQPLAVGNTIAVAIGNGAMRFASGSSQNVAIGNNALLNTSGSKNFAMGSEALSSNTTGTSNIAIGTSALTRNTTGEYNTAIGDSAGFGASGSFNTFIGNNSGYNITGSFNTIMGNYQGVAGQIISNNIVLADGQQNVKAQYSGSAWSFQDNIKLNKGTNKTTDIVSVNGSATVTNSLVTAASIILVTTQNSGTGPVYPAVVLNKGTGTFDIAHNFGSALDVAYMIINPT